VFYAEKRNRTGTVSVLIIDKPIISYRLAEAMDRAKLAQDKKEFPGIGEGLWKSNNNMGHSSTIESHS